MQPPRANLAMKNLKWFLKIALLCAVSIGFSSAHAGAYEDFFSAVRKDDVRSLRNLLGRGFDPNTLDPERRSALMLAVEEPSPQVAGVLVEQLNIDLNQLNPAGESALMLAALRGQEALAMRMIERGADVNKPGWTPLHYAATGGHLGIMRRLLAQHAFIDATSPNGTTPLMMAAQYGTAEAVKLLLDEGADPAQKNALGLNALDFARLGSRPDAIAMLTAALKATIRPDNPPPPAAATPSRGEVQSPSIPAPEAPIASPKAPVRLVPGASAAGPAQPASADHPSTSKPTGSTNVPATAPAAPVQAPAPAAPTQTPTPASSGRW